MHTLAPAPYNPSPLPLVSPWHSTRPISIHRQIGAGGMGEVHRATDTNLGRQVAIKVLPDAIAQDPERVARFEREARTLATLNHPNIAIVHGFEKGDGVRALVMELVEGPTLADRIVQGPLPDDEALPIVKQIAVAPEAAHDQGIIDRDRIPATSRRARMARLERRVTFDRAAYVRELEDDTRNGPAGRRCLRRHDGGREPRRVRYNGVLVSAGRCADTTPNLWSSPGTRQPTPDHPPTAGRLAIRPRPLAGAGGLNRAEVTSCSRIPGLAYGGR